MKKKDLRIIFMGTPDFAVPSLKVLIESGYNVVGVITAPDKEAGRGRKIMMSAVKMFALENNLNILQPLKLKDKEFIEELSALRANLQIIVAFRMLPEIVWAMPELGTFNLHASLLPQYRGAAPINFAIINGETVTGLTTFFLDKKIDTGRIIYQKEINISNDDNVGTLHDKMMERGSKLVLKTVSSILENSIESIDQSKFIVENEVLLSAPKLNKEDCRINWNNNPITIFNFVRGLSPYPASFTSLVSDTGIVHKVKIFKVGLVPSSDTKYIPGNITSDGKTYLNAEASSGVVSISEIQLSGKKRMSIADFLRGFQNIENYHFE